MTRSIRIVMLSLAAVLIAVAGAAEETTIFVDQAVDVQSPQTGSECEPFKTITQALELARRIRFGCPADQILPTSPDTIHIQVAPRDYVGTFEIPDPDKPGRETLPLVLNVPNLELKGALRIKPDGTIVPATATRLRPERPALLKQHMVVVTRTTRPGRCHFPQFSEMVGDFVTISGFFFEGIGDNGIAPTAADSQGTALLSIDGVTNFLVEKNYFTHAVVGMTARLSSGRVEDNQFVDNRGVGLNVSGGSETFPAKLQIVRNTVRDNGTFATLATPNGAGGGVGLQGAAQTENDRADLFFSYPFRRVPLPASYDRTLHPEAVPDKLDASLVHNTIEHNATFGIHVHGYLRDNYKVIPPAVMTARVTARFNRNVSRNNVNYGLVINAGQIPATSMQTHVLNVTASFALNTFAPNGIGDPLSSGNVLFGFWRFAASVSMLESLSPNFKFAHDSTVTVCGDVTQFHAENRPIDPTDNTPTHNTLTVNDIDHPISCVPIAGCIVSRGPPTSPTCN